MQNSCLPVVVTIFCTDTPAFCRQLTGKPPDESSMGAEPAEACRGIMGSGVDWLGRMLAAGFSSGRGGGRLESDLKKYMYLFKKV